jgi:hypothetical protein
VKITKMYSYTVRKSRSHESKCLQGHAPSDNATFGGDPWIVAISVYGHITSSSLLIKLSLYLSVRRMSAIVTRAHSHYPG